MVNEMINCKEIKSDSMEKKRNLFLSKLLWEKIREAVLFCWSSESFSQDSRVEDKYRLLYFTREINATRNSNNIGNYFSSVYS